MQLCICEGDIVGHLSALTPTSALSEEQRGYQELAKKFAKEEIMPVAAEHDRTGEVSAGRNGRASSLGLR